jgi:preprotein translocase subunit SecA
MEPISIWTRLSRYHRRLNGSRTEYDLTPYLTVVHDINRQAALLQNEGDNDLFARSHLLKEQARAGKGTDLLLVETFALVKETIRRVLHLDPFDEQLIGGIVLHQGKIAEMQTGEGKTVAALFPAILNGFTGKGVHVITFNDYLARRDAEWMGPVYEFLGLTVGYVQERMTIPERQKAYGADITYGTPKEAGFDFLRDGLCYETANIVQRDYNFAIIDEADSILIDEARIPLVIAGISDGNRSSRFDRVRMQAIMAHLVRGLERGRDFECDAYARNIFLTESGLERAEKMLGCGNLYEAENHELIACLQHALHAEYLLRVDRDYIVRNGGVELVDDFTGRIADKRRWPDGLQAAVEAKEECAVQSGGALLNSITLQHFLRFYPKLCGMTATALIAEEEFREFYGLPIVVIPSHRRSVRRDLPDLLFKTKNEKNDAVIREIVTVHKTGRPILVGTGSVRESTEFANRLRESGIPCNVLNAKNNESEAEVIAEAGTLGAVTISTNMAGRGTDIRLGGHDECEKTQAAALGGLYVIGTNRHESLRIDNQLRGRAGRQGDPGSSRFFVSLEDDLCLRYRLKELIVKGLFSDEQYGIEHPIVRAELNRLQRIIEGQHLEIKKTLCKYSSLIEQQRAIISLKRKGILFGSAAIDLFKAGSPLQFDRLTTAFGEGKLLRACRPIALAYLDAAWSVYLSEIAAIRDGIHLRVYGKQDPLHEFNRLAIELFDRTLHDIDRRAIESMETLTLKNGELGSQSNGVKSPSSTWTYLVNDNPFEDQLTMQLMGDPGFSAWAGLLWPLTAIHFLLKKLKKGG